MFITDERVQIDWHWPQFKNQCALEITLLQYCVYHIRESSNRLAMATIKKPMRLKNKLAIVLTTDERAQIVWQWPLSGVHSIVMVNSAQPVEGGAWGLGGWLLTPFHSIFPPPPPPNKCITPPPPPSPANLAREFYLCALQLSRER